MTPICRVLSLGAAQGYVTLIAGLEGPEGPPPPTSLFIHCPVSWLTLSGLLMSWGFVPTGLRWGGATDCIVFWFELFVNEVDWTGGVRGHGQGLARLDGDGSTNDGLARLDNADRPPGLLSDSSSSGVPASPTLPRLSSEWSSSTSPSTSPSPSPPSPMYLIHFFLRLKKWSTIFVSVYFLSLHFYSIIYQNKTNRVIVIFTHDNNTGKLHEDWLLFILFSSTLNSYENFYFFFVILILIVTEFWLTSTPNLVHPCSN